MVRQNDRFFELLADHSSLTIPTTNSIANPLHILEQNLLSAAIIELLQASVQAEAKHCYFIRPLLYDSIITSYLYVIYKNNVNTFRLLACDRLRQRAESANMLLGKALPINGLLIR
jgi:hypothetical protein